MAWALPATKDFIYASSANNPVQAFEANWLTKGSPANSWCGNFHSCTLLWLFLLLLRNAVQAAFSTPGTPQAGPFAVVCTISCWSYKTRATVKSDTSVLCHAIYKIVGIEAAENVVVSLAAVGQDFGESAICISTAKFCHLGFICTSASCGTACCVELLLHTCCCCVVRYRAPQTT